MLAAEERDDFFEIDVLNKDCLSCYTAKNIASLVMDLPIASRSRAILISAESRSLRSVDCCRTARSKEAKVRWTPICLSAGRCA